VRRPVPPPPAAPRAAGGREGAPWRLRARPRARSLMQRAIGMGIIGAGRIFEQHVRAYAALGGRARLLAVGEPGDGPPRHATGHHFIPFAHRDHREMLERGDVEVVTICTPPALHETLVIDALEAGKYVLCEKPLAPTLAGADRILAVARRFPGRLSTV